MPQVPYSPAPDVVPNLPGAPRVSIDTPPGAFGVGVAAAERGLGQQAETSANELAQTAFNVQQLRNETWAKNEFVNRSDQVGKIEQDFYNKKGVAAQAAAPQYAADIRQVYQEAIAGAPNAQAARFLGDSLSRRISYSLVEGRRHAGQQELAAAGDASVSTVAMGLNEIGKRPTDDEFFNTTLSSFDHEADVQESLGNGKSEHLRLKWKALAWESRFSTLVFDNHDQAQALLDQHKDEIPPEARKNIQAQIKNGLYTARATQSFAVQQARMDGEQTVGDITAKNVGTNAQTGEPMINPQIYKQLTDYARQNPAAERDVQERITWAEKQQDRQAKGVVVQTKPDTMAALTGNMFDASRPTRERDVLIAETNGELSHKDGTWLRTMIRTRDAGDNTALKDPAFKIAADWAKTRIEGTGQVREMNASNYAAFQFEFLNRYLNAARDNTLKPNDLDIRNPDGLLRQTADKYVPGLDQEIRSNGGATPSAPAVTPSGTEQNPTVVTTKAERDALPAGARYTRPDMPGSVFTKEGKPKAKAPVAVPQASM